MNIKNQLKVCNVYFLTSPGLTIEGGLSQEYPSISPPSTVRSVHFLTEFQLDVDVEVSKGHTKIRIRDREVLKIKT